jgi:hypothetical protein
MHLFIMKSTLIIFLSLLYLTSYCQDKKLLIPKSMKKVGQLSYQEYEKKKCNYFNIKQLSKDTSSCITYRITNSRQIIEVSVSGENYNGFVISHTFTYVEYEKRGKVKEEIKFHKTPLTPDTSKIVFEMFSLLDSIPDMEEIKDWGRGFDGVIYALEKATDKNYQIKTYWSPNTQSDSTHHRSEIISFVENIYSKLNLSGYYWKFISNLPKGDYTDGFINSTITRNKKRNKKYKIQSVER